MTGTSDTGALCPIGCLYRLLWPVYTGCYGGAFAVLLGTKILLREAFEIQLHEGSRTAGMEAVEAAR